MKKSTLWILGIALVICGYYYMTPSTPRTITTYGECFTTAPRDKTAITLRVTTLDKNALTSMRNATTKMAEINAYLANLDVKTQTTKFDSDEKTEWDDTTHRYISLGTETTISVDISANNIDVIEQILNQFAGQPDIYVGNLKMFTSRETMRPIMDNCLETAVKNAREHAQSLAAGGKSRIGKMISVSYGDTHTSKNNDYIVAKSVSMDANAFGSITNNNDTDISVKVSATFEIK